MSETIQLTRVDVAPFYLEGAFARGSRHTQWWFGSIGGGEFIRVIRSYDYPPGWHISASIGGDFGTRSTRPPTDDEMRPVLSALGNMAPGAVWDDSVEGNDPNVRHFWAVKEGAA